MKDTAKTDNPNSKIMLGFKYTYLAIFFVLLSGFFHPIITETSFNGVLMGAIVLAVGLAGAVLLYKAASSENRRIAFLAGGFALLGISLYYIFQLAGRF